MKTLQLYCLQITEVNNTLLAGSWRPGAFLVYSPKESQEPAMGFGNFDTYEATPYLICASFWANSSDALRAKADAASKVYGVVVEARCLEETPF